MIDELSGRVPKNTGIDAAYGGGRPFPHLTTGLLHGDHPAVGRQVHQPTIDGTPLDDLLGDGFAIIVDGPSTADAIRGEWDRIAEIVTVPPGSLPASLPPGGAAIIRPDRYVAAVADDADQLERTSRELLARIRPN